MLFVREVVSCLVHKIEYLDSIELVSRSFEFVYPSHELVHEIPYAYMLFTHQEHFTAASQLLFSATKRRAYFRHITIFIPDTWTGVYDDAGTEDYSSANIIIHASGSNLRPRTRQFEGCRIGGDQIFLSSGHMNTLTSNLQGISAGFPHGQYHIKTILSSSWPNQEYMKSNSHLLRLLIHHFKMSGVVRNDKEQIYICKLKLKYWGI